MKQDVFSKAKASVSTSMIEYFLGSNGVWKGSEYHLPNPLRSEDTQAGSFSISVQNGGQWYDFADGSSGDLISLLQKKLDKNPAQVATLMIQFSEEHPNQKNDKGIAEKAKKLLLKDLYYPVPRTLEAAFHQDLANFIGFMVQKFLEHQSSHYYYSASGELLFVQTRFFCTKTYRKQFMPIFLKKNDNKLYFKNPLTSNRPLYNLHQLTSQPKAPVLVVEGELCADVRVEGYVVVSWLGGSRAVAKSDWQPLLKRKVFLWPDNDQPGIEAMQQIKRDYVPHATVLHIDTKKAKGWDLKDAVREEKDFSAPRFIEQHAYRLMDVEVEDSAFTALGYTATEWVFYLHDVQQIYFLRDTSVTSIQIVKLAPMSWWRTKGFVSDNGAFKLLRAVDFLAKLCKRVGYFVFDTPTAKADGILVSSCHVYISYY